MDLFGNMLSYRNRSIEILDLQVTRDGKAGPFAGCAPVERGVTVNCERHAGGEYGGGEWLPFTQVAGCKREPKGRSGRQRTRSMHLTGCRAGGEAGQLQDLGAQAESALDTRGQ